MAVQNYSEVALVDSFHLAVAVVVAVGSSYLQSSVVVEGLVVEGKEERVDHQAVGYQVTVTCFVAGVEGFDVDECSIRLCYWCQLD